MGISLARQNIFIHLHSPVVRPQTKHLARPWTPGAPCATPTRGLCSKALPGLIRGSGWETTVVLRHSTKKRGPQKHPDGNVIGWPDTQGRMVGLQVEGDRRRDDDVTRDSWASVWRVLPCLFWTSMEISIHCRSLGAMV